MKTTQRKISLCTIITALGLAFSNASLAQDIVKAPENKVKSVEKSSPSEGNLEPAGKAKQSVEKSKETPPTTAETKKPLPTDPEERFKMLFTKGTLSGRWAPLKDGKLGEEKSGDKYDIVGVTKGTGDNWTVNAKMKYREQEFLLPIPVQMKFAGDSAILVVDKLSIPGGGTYSARLLLYERTYSGTWTGARGGGMLYGVITNETE